MEITCFKPLLNRPLPALQPAAGTRPAEQNIAGAILSRHERMRAESTSQGFGRADRGLTWGNGGFVLSAIERNQIGRELQGHGQAPRSRKQVPQPGLSHQTKSASRQPGLAPATSFSKQPDQPRPPGRLAEHHKRGGSGHASSVYLPWPSKYSPY